MKKILAICLTLALSVNISAQTASTASVDKLLEVSGAEKAVDGVYAQMDQMLAGMAGQMGLTDAEKPILSKYSVKFKKILQDDMSWSKLKGPISEIYAKTFSETDIKGLITFYESPAGKVFVEKMPLVMQESAQLSQKMMVDVMPKIQEVAKEMGAEIKSGREKK